MCVLPLLQHIVLECQNRTTSNKVRTRKTMIPCEEKERLEGHAWLLAGNVSLIYPVLVYSVTCKCLTLHTCIM